MINPPGHLLQHDREISHSDVDDFLALVNDSVRKRIEQLNIEWEASRGKAYEEADGTLVYMKGDDKLEEIDSCHSTLLLAEELCIMALYKKVEIKTFLMVKVRLRNGIMPRNFGELLRCVDGAEQLEGYSAVNELRLLNNSIKHNGQVSSALADEFSNWRLNAQLLELGDTYRRLLPQVKRFVLLFARAVYSRSNEDSLSSNSPPSD
jgi:hypothetical protein